MVEVDGLARMIRGVDFAAVTGGDTSAEGGREKGKGEGRVQAVLNGSSRDGDAGDADIEVMGLGWSLISLSYVFECD
jgi:hypothetical protein